MQQIHDSFIKTVWGYYDSHPRDMPWRKDTQPYYILVSEIMLQQTQVERVIPKFQAFVHSFPDIKSLANAPQSDVLKLWLGLGYNRRAKFLHQAAQKVVSDFNGEIPQTLHELESLPGVGPNTAGAILTYAFNQPVIFIETNIRSVFIHHFFKDKGNVADKDLLPHIETTLDKTNPREWYWALMDYGTHLKKQAGNNIHRSKHYKKQSTFQGSDRQLRGRVLGLLAGKPYTASQLTAEIGDTRLHSILHELKEEKLITHSGGTWRLY